MLASERVARIIHDCGILSYSVESWRSLTASDWTALAEDWPPCLGNMAKMQFAVSCFGYASYSEFLKVHREEARAKLEWLTSSHSGDYFAVVPRDIVTVVLLFLRVWNRDWWECDDPQTALLGLQHSWDDQPSYKYECSDGAAVTEWHWNGFVHREGGQPAHARVNVQTDEYYFKWFLRGDHGRIGSTITHMQRIRAEYSYGIPEDLVVTTDPAVVAEIDALVARYASE